MADACRSRRRTLPGRAASPPVRRDPHRRWSAAPARSTGCSPRPTPTPGASSTSTTRSSCSSSPCLSAQTTDKRVNAVRPDPVRGLPRRRRRWPPPTAQRLEAIIGPLGFFRAKTESLLKLSQALVERFDGEVPPRLDDLVTLPGVGRKTANVVLGNAFGIPGITVDTHFGRLARRFGWTDETDPVKVEHAVGALFPKRDWTMLSHHLIWHGRRRLPRPQARLRRLPGRALVPVVRRGPDRPGRPPPTLVRTEGRA